MNLKRALEKAKSYKGPIIVEIEDLRALYTQAGQDVPRELLYQDDGVTHVSGNDLINLHDKANLISGTPPKGFHH